MTKPNGGGSRRPVLGCLLSAALLAVALAALSAGGADASRPLAQAQAPRAPQPATASFQQWQQSTPAPSSSSFRRGLESIGAVAGIGGNDDLLRGLVVDVANGGGGDAFDNFYQLAQLRMLSSLDDSLAAFAADALYDNDAIKSAGIRFQSPLGGRKAQLGADIIGAMKQHNDETNQYAIGWQLHLYAAEKGNKGASGGIFYRRITNNILYGVNIFADYEDHDYGEFYRWGLGGELKNKHVRFAANYYLPVGGDKTINSTVLAYSREGYDANLQIAIPGASYLQAEAAYYYYAGKQKGEEDKGFRYGAALSPGAGVILKVFYDDGGDDFGGELSWHYIFNNPTYTDSQRHDTPIITAADLFAPVLREYSQRIITASAIPPPRVSLDIRVVGIVTTTMTTDAMTITTTTTAGGGMISITRMTTDAVITETPQFSFDFMTTRVASVEFTTRVQPIIPAAPQTYHVSTLNFAILVTLPEVITRPLVLTIERNLLVPSRLVSGRGFIVIESNTFGIGSFSGPPDGVRPYTISVVEGSEHGQSTMTTTMTMTTGTVTTTTPPITTATTMTIGGEVATTTTMTIQPITTTTRLTTFATTRITLTTSAMGELSGGIMGGDTLPFNDGNNKGGNITKPPLAIALSPSSSFRPRRHSRAHHRHSRAAGAGISQPKRRFPRYQPRMTG